MGVERLVLRGINVHIEWAGCKLRCMRSNNPLNWSRDSVIAIHAG